MSAETSGAPNEPVCRRLLDFRQAAQAARESHGVPAEWVWHLVMTGEIPVYHLAGPRIDEVELARVLAARPSRRR